MRYLYALLSISVYSGYFHILPDPKYVQSRLISMLKLFISELSCVSNSECALSETFILSSPVRIVFSPYAVAATKASTSSCDPELNS